MKNTRKKKKVKKELEKVCKLLFVNLLSNKTFTVLFISLFPKKLEKLLVKTSQFPKIKFRKNMLSTMYILLIYDVIL